MFMSELFLNLLNRAMAAGWVVLAVLLLRLLLKKAPRWVHCGLWGLVGLRLVWPFSLESVLSLLPSREVLSPETLYDPTPAVHTGIEFVNSAVNESFTPAMTAQAGASVNPLQIWTWLAGWIWAMGAAALLGYALFSFLRLRKRVAVSVEDHGLWRCDAIDSPFILGVFRPRIYVPSDLGDGDLVYVAAHERAHLKRRDHWWKPLGYLLLTVFWFHPLLWVGYILLCRDIELACDETVIRDLDASEKKAYSIALVDCAVDRRAIAACPVAFGEVGVKQRVKSVLHYKKPAFWVVVIAVVLCVLAAVCFLTDPVTFSPDFDRADMALARTMDLRLNSGPLTQELNGSELDELWGRLRDLKQTKRGDFYGGFTPFYSLSLQLTNGQWIRIQGYALDGSMTDLVYGEDVYRINDEDFQSYLDRLCAGGSRQPAPGEFLRDPLYDGIWISTRCVYMNPFSSQLAEADSGYVYSCGTRFDEDGHKKGEHFGIMHRKYRLGTSIDVSAANALEWEPLTLTDAEWAEMFQMEVGIPDISGYTDRFRILLDETYSLLSMDGELWIMELKNGYPWSIYALRRTETYEEAWWSYMEGVDETHRPMVLEFDWDFDQLRLDCDQGQIFGATTNVNFEEKIYYSGQSELIYWTPLNEDGTTAPDRAEITFSVWKNDAITAEGVLTIDRHGKCGIQVNGSPVGTVCVKDSAFNLLFTAELPADGPPMLTLRDYLLDLTPSEIGYVSWAGVNEAPTAEELLPMVQRACRTTVETELFLEYWNLEFYVGDRNAGTWNGDDAIHLRVGLSEPVIHISGGRNLPDGDLYAADEELYWLLRTMYDTEPQGVDDAAHEVYREWVDPLLTEPEVLPLAAGNVEITKELTGLVLVDHSPKLNAQAYGVDIVWHVKPKETAFDLTAGGAVVDSQLNIHGMNGSSRYLIVVDGQPVGFVGWWFLMDKTLDDQFETKEALIEAVIHDG